MRDSILDMLSRQCSLPPFPDIITRLQKIIHDPHTGIPEISELIKMDPALSGRVLNLANSVYYNTGLQKIKALTTAINKLGLIKIKHIVYSMELTKLFDNCKALDYFQFWRHSLSVAIFTQHLSRYINTSEDVQDTAYLAGLMHDVGIMVFVCLIPEEYAEFTEMIHDREDTLEQHEKNRFNIDHQELGALFIKKWWLVDDEIVNAVRYHHFPFRGVKKELQCEQLVNIADGICNSQGFTNGLECCHGFFREGAWQEIGLSLTNVENIISDVDRSMEQTMDLLKDLKH